MKSREWSKAQKPTSGRKNINKRLSSIWRTNLQSVLERAIDVRTITEKKKIVSTTGDASCGLLSQTREREEEWQRQIVRGLRSGSEGKRRPFQQEKKLDQAHVWLFLHFRKRGRAERHVDALHSLSLHFHLLTTHAGSRICHHSSHQDPDQHHARFRG